MKRRTFISQLGFGVAGLVLSANEAEALLWGLLLRSFVSNLARRSATRFIGRTLARSTARSSSNRVVRGRLSNAEQSMARSNVGSSGSGFSRLLKRQIGKAARDAIRDEWFSDHAYLGCSHAETRTGNAQCCAFTSNVNRGGRNVVYLESPELIALDRLAEKFDRYGNGSGFTTRHTFPIFQEQKGKFDFRGGRFSPSVLRTAEGVVKITSFVSTDQDYAASAAEFFADINGRRRYENGQWEWRP